MTLCNCNLAEDDKKSSFGAAQKSLWKVESHIKSRPLRKPLLYVSSPSLAQLMQQQCDDVLSLLLPSSKS